MLSNLKLARKVSSHLKNISFGSLLIFTHHIDGDEQNEIIDFDLDAGTAEDLIIQEILSTLRKDPNYLLSITEQENGGVNYKLTTTHHKLIKQGSEPSFYLAALRMFEAYCGDRFSSESNV